MAAKLLAAAEAARLAECERIIADGIDKFMAVGNALTEIRDDKLYRVTHRSFETYCLDKWRMGKAHAYRLIEHVNAVGVISEAAGISSPTGDISERATRAIKADLPAVVDDIKARREAGEAPEDAAKNAIEAKRQEQAEEKRKAQEAAAEARRNREAEQAGFDRDREAHSAKLPAFVAEREQRKADAIAARKARGTESEADTEALEARISELEDENAALKEDIAAVRKENAFYADMKVEYEQGGYDEIVSGLKQQIAVMHRQIETFTTERAAEKRRGDFFKRKAQEHGWSNFEDIDLREGANG